MMSWNRGRELPGLFNPDVVNDLFTQQCQPWQNIVVDMTRDIFEGVCGAAESMIRHSTADDAADEIVLLVKAGIGDYKTSMDAKVNELLQLHNVLHAITYNPQLTINVQAARRARRRAAMAKRISEIFGTRVFSDVDTKVTINPAQVTELLLDEVETDMGRYGTSIAVDYMQAYYDVS
jgi:hypothetical protein